jgi:hypothetical protein
MIVTQGILRKDVEKYNMHAHQIWHVLRVKGDGIGNRKKPMNK